MTTIITALADLVDTSAGRYARSFGPLMPTRVPVEKSVRTISVFRAH
jgi:hypothetical protein